MKIEIYPIHTPGVLATVEFDDWWISDKNGGKLVIEKGNNIVAEFMLNNIAGFKEVR